MKIYLATDHAGFKLKEFIKGVLLKTYEIEDCGALTFNKNDDYPYFISKAAQKVAADHDSRGIFFGKSGTGECIVANKIKNIRAVIGFSKKNVELSRLDNDANVLTLGSGFSNNVNALRLINTFLRTPFSNEERHKRRISEIADIENFNKI